MVSQTSGFWAMVFGQVSTPQVGKKRSSLMTAHVVQMGWGKTRQQFKSNQKKSSQRFSQENFSL